MKRIPKSKSGKLLVIVRDNIGKEIMENVKRHGATALMSRNADEAIMKIMKLNSRIEGRLIREDIKAMQTQQLSLINTYKVDFIKKRRKKISTELVDAINKRKANKLIREKFKGSQIKKTEIHHGQISSKKKSTKGKGTIRSRR